MPASTSRATSFDFKDWVISTVIILAVRLVGLLPYRLRVPAGGWMVSAVAAPLIGYRQRIRDNLAMMFKRIAGAAPVTGGGFEALEAARAAGRPVILVSGHFGNYDAVRSALIQRGFKVGGLYRAMNMGAGAPLTFFGHTAYTALSAGEMALRYDALLVPCYGVRQPDGLSYEIVIEPPVPHTDAETMTQALNDSLEAQVRAHMDQWLWMHRRWKSL